jgi:dTDP-4-amino-4,6-dideoxygalactose transaminase
MLLEGRLARGKHVESFEKAFKNLAGSGFACGCTSGTAALELIFRALAERSSQTYHFASGSVAVPSNTFLATAMAPLSCGLRLIFIDNDPIFGQMCPDDLARKIRPDTRAVVLVHVGGFISPRWREIKAIAEKNGAAFIEDAAHAHGAEIDQKRAGSLGIAGAFSFYPTKVLTTAEGGMVTTSDSGLYNTIHYLRQHGQDVPGSKVHQHFGLNYRPSEIHALLGLRMMEKASWILSERRRLAKNYDKLVNGLALSSVVPTEEMKPSYYKYIARLPEGADRQTVKRRLYDEFEVSLAGEVYSTPGHLQPVFQNHPEYLAAPVESLPNAERWALDSICLPLYPGLGEDAQQYVVHALSKVLS